ncbi:hypothetical protein SARC_11268, partial [Sphaeroforma arctica JP610]
IRCATRQFLISKWAQSLWDKGLRGPTSIATEIRVLHTLPGDIKFDTLVKDVSHWRSTRGPPTHSLRRQRAPIRQYTETNPVTQVTRVRNLYDAPNQIYGHSKQHGPGGRAPGRFILDTVTVFKGGLEKNMDPAKIFMVHMCVDSMTSMVYIAPVYQTSVDEANLAFASILKNDIFKYEETRDIPAEYRINSVTTDNGPEFTARFDSTNYYGFDHTYSDPYDKTFTFLLDSVVSVLQQSIRQSHAQYSVNFPDKIVGSKGLTYPAVQAIIQRINRTPKPFLRKALGRDASPMDVTNQDFKTIATYISSLKQMHHAVKNKDTEWTVALDNGTRILRGTWEYRNWEYDCTYEIVLRPSDDREGIDWYDLPGLYHNNQQLSIKRREKQFYEDFRMPKNLVLVHMYKSNTSTGLGGRQGGSIQLDTSRVFVVRGTSGGSLQLQRVLLDPNTGEPAFEQLGVGDTTRDPDFPYAVISENGYLECILLCTMADTL